MYARVLCAVCVTIHIDYEFLSSFIVWMLAAQVPLAEVQALGAVGLHAMSR